MLNLAVILEEIPVPRDGLDHICGYGGRKYAHKMSETVEYATQFADPRQAGTARVWVRGRPGRDRARRGRTGSFLGILGGWAWGPLPAGKGPSMNLLQGHEATCPHCWETISLTLDLSVPEQSYIEDCPVCCKPMLVSYSAADGELDALSVDPSD
jgi:hypothetical protein